MVDIWQSSNTTAAFALKDTILMFSCLAR